MPPPTLGVRLATWSARALSVFQRGLLRLFRKVRPLAGVLAHRAVRGFAWARLNGGPLLQRGAALCVQGLARLTATLARAIRWAMPHLFAALRGGGRFLAALYRQAVRVLSLGLRGLRAGVAMLGKQLWAMSLPASLAGGCLATASLVILAIHAVDGMAERSPAEEMPTVTTVAPARDTLVAVAVPAPQAEAMPHQAVDWVEPAPERILAPPDRLKARRDEVFRLPPPPRRRGSAAETAEPVAAVPPPERPAWQRFAASAPASGGAPRIVLVIDDLGLNPRAAERLAKMDGPLTLAFLPYADGLAAQTRAVRAAGHELLVHLPMEPESSATDPGPMALRTQIGKAEFARRIAWNLSRFDGFVGINNHMGSRLTANRDAMGVLMRELKARGLLFLDSWTTPESVAEAAAIEAGLPYAGRDVFLDNEISGAAVRARLAQLETIAAKTGLAIGIGHPHAATLDAVDAWLPRARRRGFVLMPLSAVVEQPERRIQQAAAAAGVTPTP